MDLRQSMERFYVGMVVNEDVYKRQVHDVAGAFAVFLRIHGNAQKAHVRTHAGTHAIIVLADAAGEAVSYTHLDAAWEDAAAEDANSAALHPIKSRTAQRSAIHFLIPLNPSRL